MRTAVISDLHLGSAPSGDLAARPEPLRRLVEAIDGSDRLVILGDLLELREQPVRAVLEAAAPVLAALDEAMAGREVVIVAGNHDHELIAPALERSRLADGRAPLTSEMRLPLEPHDVAGGLAARLSRSQVSLAYPGVWLRDDVYATHGHYLDLHLTIPRLECLIAAAVVRLGGRPRVPASADDYEAALAPIYAFAYAAAQHSSRRSLRRNGSLTRTVWRAVNPGPGRRRTLSGLALGKAAIPTGVGLVNALGLGPFSADISAQELRRAGLRAIGEVVRGLGVEADHVIFGHTHRAGPLPADPIEEWTLANGTTLTNTGSWMRESDLLGGGGPANPYWPGRVTLLDDEGPPRLVDVLRDAALD